MALYPDIIVHEITSGNTFTGVATDGTLDTAVTDDPYYDGRVKFYGQGTQGGLFESPELVGMFLQSIALSDPSGQITKTVVSIQQELYPSGAPVATEYIVLDTTAPSAAVSSQSSFHIELHQPIFIPPRARLKIVTTGNVGLGDVARLQTRFGGGWGYIANTIITG